MLYFFQKWHLLGCDDFFTKLVKYKHIHMFQSLRPSFLRKPGTRIEGKPVVKSWQLDLEASPLQPRNVLE